MSGGEPPLDAPPPSSPAGPPEPSPARPHGWPPRHRPPWWPEGEAWPPAGGPWAARGGPGWRFRERRRRRAHFRGIGCLFVAVATVMVSLGVVVLWLLGTLLSGVPASGPVAFLARGAALVLLVAVFVALAAGLGFGRRLVGPLGDLVAAARRIEAGDFSVRVAPITRGPRDLRALSAAFNTMAARLETEEVRRRRLLADLGHELRTPIAVIEGHLEAVLDGVYPADRAHLDPILDETRVLERLVDDLRTVSLAEAGSLSLHREPVDLRHLIDDVVGVLRPRIEAAGASVAVEVDSSIPELELDPVRIHQVLANLLDNALRYTPAGGAVHIAARRAADVVEIDVADEGPGLAPDLRDSLFDRFVKAPDSPGSGLGLAIAKAIVEAHRGNIRAEAAAPHGTRIVVTLPAS